MTNMTKQKKDFAVFGISETIFSSDPLDYDYLIHHHAFSSVFAKLVSIEKNGVIFPMLASSWSNKNSFKEWHFKIKDNLTYSNGDKITIEDIALNFKRLVYLKNKKDSKSGVLEFLEGFSSFNNISDSLTGIRTQNNELIFIFNKPMPDLLEKISFGFYGLAHPSLYDQKTGKWLDNQKTISSGPYEVSKWDSESFELKLRENKFFYSRSNQIKKIKLLNFTKVKNNQDIQEFDFLIADKQSLLVNDSFEYVGSAEKLKLGYVNVFSALKNENILSNIDVRKWFRHKFYLGLEKNNFPITGSFFPLNLRGIKPLVANHEAIKPNFKHFTIYSYPFNFSGKLEEYKNKKSIVEIFSDAMNELGNNSGASLVLEERKDYDIDIRGSGIEANDYWDTVKFMFLSKDGIRLPDITGRIYKELEKENPDINVINQELWDQAIIWPIRHYTTGYWFNKKSDIDYSEINFNSPAVDFQFFGWK